MMRWFFRLGISFVALCIFAMASDAQEFRKFNPIPTPGAAPKGATRVAAVQPVDTQMAKSAAEKVLKAWNSGGLDKYLSADFYDKSRLTDAMTEKVPRDANVRVLSVKRVQTLQQFRKGNEIISTVSVTADTQIEFNDVNKGFRRLEGENEYILRITEEVVP